jgi:hypothetical protein
MDEPLADTSRAFLARAQGLLSESRPECLLYAALELRLGIEARYHEYLDAAAEVSSLKKRGWQVSQLAKDLERVFKTGEKIASFQFLEGKNGPAKQTLLYTPIRRHTRTIAERLGDYLHYTERFMPRHDKWWSDFRALVAEGVEGLRDATTGTLLGPPLMRRGQGVLLVEYVKGLSSETVQQAMPAPGETIHVKVDYHDTIPTPHAA